ncbi:hypothetical protein DTO282F9_9251 [Paecilomyces variotii]|nr:hypothetical protein DTO282F9_9251 [Paecilomyces variotii]
MEEYSIFFSCLFSFTYPSSTSFVLDLNNPDLAFHSLHFLHLQVLSQRSSSIPPTFIAFAILGLCVRNVVHAAISFAQLQKTPYFTPSDGYSY